MRCDVILARHTRRPTSLARVPGRLFVTEARRLHRDIAIEDLTREQMGALCVRHTTPAAACLAKLASLWLCSATGDLATHKFYHADRDAVTGIFRNSSDSQTDIFDRVEFSP